jgi:LysR family transcriptional regulator for metE and metH
MVITSDPVENEAVKYLPLFRYELVLAVSRQSPLEASKWIEPEDITDQTLITYPVERERLDVFTAFLNPANAEPAAIRTAELTPMTAQLVAAGRGVAALPNWALTEYTEHDLLKTVRLGEKGVWRTLYAAVRVEDDHTPYMQEFWETAKELCFKTLSGVRAVKGS